MQWVNLGGVPVGDGHPVVFVAEIGTFFNQEIGRAIDYVHAAAEAGVDVLKTELLHNADVCIAGTGLVHSYRHARGVAEEDYRGLIERKTLPLSDYRRVFRACRELALPIICSVYDAEGIDFLVDEGGAAVKFARDSLTNLPLIRYAAGKGVPIQFDAGNTHLDELARAVREARDHGAAGVVVNHHPAANPASAEVQNLRVLETYRRAFGAPVGLSCLYRGHEIMYAAIGAGVNLIEKGIVDDPDRQEQDLVSAVRLSDLKAVVAVVKNCWQALGDGVPAVRRPRDQSSWKGLVARRPIRQGEPLALDNVGFAFPPLGLSPESWDAIAGRAAARDLQAGEPIHWRDVLFAEEPHARAAG
jgi:sialic acid synthase SpsE